MSKSERSVTQTGKGESGKGLRGFCLATGNGLMPGWKERKNVYVVFFLLSCLFYKLTFESLLCFLDPPLALNSLKNRILADHSLGEHVEVSLF